MTGVTLSKPHTWSDISGVHTPMVCQSGLLHWLLLSSNDITTMCIKWDEPYYPAIPATPAIPSTPATHTLQIHHCAYCNILFWIFGWVYFRVINYPFAITCIENEGWAYFQETTVLDTRHGVLTVLLHLKHP